MYFVDVINDITLGSEEQRRHRTQHLEQRFLFWRNMRKPSCIYAKLLCENYQTKLIKQMGIYRTVWKGSWEIFFNLALDQLKRICMCGCLWKEKKIYGDKKEEEVKEE